MKVYEIRISEPLSVRTGRHIHTLDAKSIVVVWLDIKNYDIFPQPERGEKGEKGEQGVKGDAGVNGQPGLSVSNFEKFSSKNVEDGILQSLFKVSK